VFKELLKGWYCPFVHFYGLWERVQKFNDHCAFITPHLGSTRNMFNSAFKDFQ